MNLKKAHNRLGAASSLGVPNRSKNTNPKVGIFWHNLLMLKLITAITPDYIEVVRALFYEYAKELNIDLQFQNFEEELAELPGKYSSPEGVLALAYWNESLAGCVGLRPIQLDAYPNACEMKRLYVRPQFRENGIGFKLMELLIEEAKSKSYKFLLLDTLPFLTKAQVLYRRFGFSKIDAYYKTPFQDITYFKLDLT